jgi:hypothetical protein
MLAHRGEISNTKSIMLAAFGEYNDDDGITITNMP